MNREVDPTACEETACRTKVDLFRHLRGASSSSSSSSSSSPTGTTTPRSELIALYQSRKDAVLQRPGQGECPPDREELGRATWALMHSVAAYYPDQPNVEDKRAARGLVSAIARLYPCSHCREDFRTEVERSPPKVESQEEFSRWVCEQHNAVNDKLGRQAFTCGDPGALRERWRFGSERCRESWRGEETAGESLGQE